MNSRREARRSGRHSAGACDGSTETRSDTWALKSATSPRPSARSPLAGREPERCHRRIGGAVWGRRARARRRCCGSSPGWKSRTTGSGAILFHDEDVARRQVGSRQVGFVFQHYALFRHMTVFENVAFGLRVRPKPQRPAGT